MNVSMEELAAWMLADETEHLEFKEAKNDFDALKLVKYCAALANEGGGHLVLGVADHRPRSVVGSQAFRDLQATKNHLVTRLRMRVDADELPHPEGRVVVFRVPARPIGTAIQVDGAYWMRAGESLVAMTPDALQRIFAESQPDYSAELCRGAAIDDLDTRAIERFRDKWIQKSKADELRDLSVVRLLEDAELLIDGQPTYAALVLLGTHRALGRHLGQAELVFEYRSDEASIPYQQRKEFREGFLLYDDDLWSTISLRNDLFSFQDGLFRREIPAFNETAVREAILNAVSHRDYRLGGSTFVKQFPHRIQIDSPGGFPTGITAQNILERQYPRNRRLADAFARCGLVERSGQGADRMFSAAVREGKLPPDFGGSDDYLVSVVLHGQVQDERFLTFLERLSTQHNRLLSLDDLIVLDAVHRELRIPERVKSRIQHLLGLGAIERVSKSKMILSKRFYTSTGRAGEYTRRKGLDRDTRKALLLKHIERAGDEGAPFEELSQVLPEASRNDIKVLLRDLKLVGQAHVRGVKRAARWYLGPGGGAMPGSKRVPKRVP